MLRNTCTYVQYVPSNRYINIGRITRGASSSSSRKHNQILRQSRIMAKLSGDKIAGSKKHIFPTQIDVENKQRSHASSNNNILFRPGRFVGLDDEANSNQHISPIAGNKLIGGGGGGGGGRTNTRRMNVLNKLFMEQISGLLATGEISDEILGKGLQISRVRISHDFRQLSVYWSTTKPNIADSVLEKELQRCSGLLRHELSRLCLMGRVPRITFIKDTLQANLFHVDELLRRLNLDGNKTAETNENMLDEDTEQQDFPDHSHPSLKEYFYGLRQSMDTTEQDRSQMDLSAEAQDERGEETFSSNWPPPMRHDVFGLDHKGIMLKILRKMRKSTQAWEQYNKQQGLAVTGIGEKNESVAAITTMEQKRSIKQEQAHEDLTKAKRFRDYLDEYRRKELITAIPNRKKLRRTMDRGFYGADGQQQTPEEESYLMSEKQRQLYEEEDNDDDDFDEDPKNHTSGGRLL